MNAFLRAKAILLHPAAEWTRIEQESGDPAYLLSHYVVLLALVPAVFGFVGASVIGVVVPGVGTARAPIVDGILGAIFDYVAAFGTVLLLGLIIDGLTLLFGGRRHFETAFKLAVYSYTPAWLVGIFLLLPGLRFLMLFGFYGAYLLATGLPRLTKLPAQKSQMVAALVVVCACVLAYVAAAAQRSLFGGPGL